MSPAKKPPPARLRPKPLPVGLARLVRKNLKDSGTPGAAVGFLHRGKAYAQGFGTTNIDAPSPVDTDTLFQVGSTGKTFTACAVMRLVDKGEIDLDAPVRRYVKTLKLKDPDVTRSVTVRHLLTHTGGWAGDAFFDTGRGEDALAAAVAQMKTLPQLTPLGEIWHYNNAGFYLAGHVIEKVYGRPYELAVKEILLDPLGMTHSFFFAEEAILHRVAAGHVAKGKKQTGAGNWWLNRAMTPAGGLISDVVDQLRWGQFNLGDGRSTEGMRILKKSTMKAMQSPQALAGSMADHVGYSWLLEDFDGVRLVSHGGTTVGQLSAFAMVPSEQLAVTSMTNSTSGRSLNRDVVDWVLKNYAGIERSLPKPMRLRGVDLTQYEGRYLEAFKRQALDVSVNGKRLKLQLVPLSDEAGAGAGIPPFSLALFDHDRAILSAGEFKGLRFEFLRDGRNRVNWLRFGGRLYKRSAASRPKRKSPARRR